MFWRTRVPLRRAKIVVTPLEGTDCAGGAAALAEIESEAALVKRDAAKGSRIRIALLTGGDDWPYALGMASALASHGIGVDFIGSDKLDNSEVHRFPSVTFLNLRGDQNEDAPSVRKLIRILAYYVRLARYVATAKVRVLHILWNNRFELFDRTVLMVYYRLLGKRVVLTAHNVNAGKRDSCDTWLNRFSLRIQYRLCDHIFVHTDRMKAELIADFAVPQVRVSVIPFGINNTIPTTELTRGDARKRLGLPVAKTLLFFGQIAPYKGLEYLVAALVGLAARGEMFHLIIAGRVKRGHSKYWDKIQDEIARAGIKDCVTTRIEFIPDCEVELYFKAADVVVLPYVNIFQSGVPFLSYSFGLPVIASDVGSFQDDVIEGKTGFVCRPRNPDDLAKKIEVYFSSDLYEQLATNRDEIRNWANERHSWSKVGEIIDDVYRRMFAI